MADESSSHHTLPAFFGVQVVLNIGNMESRSMFDGPNVSSAEASFEDDRVRILEEISDDMGDVLN